MELEKISPEMTEPETQLMEPVKMSSEPREAEKKPSKLIIGEKDMHCVDEICIECDVCKANPEKQTTYLSSAVKRCEECEQNLCSLCIRDHLRQKMLKNHHIVDILLQLGEDATVSNNSNTQSGRVEPTSCEDQDSTTGFWLDTTTNLSSSHAQGRISGTDVLAQLGKERERISVCEREISDKIDRLLKGQEDIRTTKEKTTEVILRRRSEYIARVKSDTKSLLEQLGSITEAKSSKMVSQIQEAQGYLQKLADRRTNLEKIVDRGSVGANDESIACYDLLLHVCIQPPIPSLYISFKENSFFTNEAGNVLGRLEEHNSISKAQTGSIMESYMNFLSNVHRQIADARECHWKVSLPSAKAIEELYDADFLQCVLDELGLSKTDKKWYSNLQFNHMKMVSLLLAMSVQNSELSPDDMESCLKAIQLKIEKLWNTIQFQIYYRNSEKGLVPKGLKNYGNTCYFNSVMQCLFQTVLLVFEMTLNLYSLGNVTKDVALSKACMELVAKYSHTEQRNTVQETLYQLLTRLTRFSNGRQHDSHDLLIHFLDSLRVEERNGWKSLRIVGDETSKTMTVVDKIFGGQLITVYTCRSCDEPYAIREPFLDISLPLCNLSEVKKKREQRESKSTIPNALSSNSPSDQTNEQQNVLESSKAWSQQRPDNNTGNDSYRREVIKNIMKTLIVEPTAKAEDKSFLSRVVSDFWSKPPNISQCLQYFIRAEEIDGEYLCRNCQPPSGSDEPRLTSATKRTLISSPPAILVLHLKRFEQMPIVGFVKRDEMIPYEELLDLGPFCSCSAQRIDPEEKNVWYSLYAVVVHCGKFLSQGHYVAYVKERDSRGQLLDRITDKFLQNNPSELENIPNDDDVEAMEKRKRIAERKTAEPPDSTRGQWYYCSDELVRLCDAKEALDQKAFLLFYERIPGSDHKNTDV